MRWHYHTEEDHKLLSHLVKAGKELAFVTEILLY